MLKGLPGSGKTRYTSRLIGNFQRISFDDLRLYVPGNERAVQQAAYQQAELALLSGMSVVWDNTSLDYRHEGRLRDLAEQHGAQFDVKFFDVTPEQAIENDSKRLEPVGANVIYAMHNKYLS